MRISENKVLINSKELKRLRDNDKFYTLLTKTSAKKAVTNLLKFFNFTCWHDTEEPDDGDGTCSHCPLINVLGDDAGTRICLRDKNWMK